MSSTASILIIQNDRCARPQLAAEFKENDWTVYLVDTVESALTEAHKHSPSLILLDVGPVDGQGNEIGTQLKSDGLAYSIPIVVVTSAEASSFERDAHWAADVITGSDSLPTLMARIHHLLAKQHKAQPYVLVVDDEPDLVDITVAELKKAGFIASGASNGAEALEVVKKVQPDAVLLDLDMPLLNGWEFLNQIKEQMAHLSLPIVILTGADRRLEDRQEALDLGVADYLLKPCDPFEIIEALKKAMDAKPE